MMGVYSPSFYVWETTIVTDVASGEIFLDDTLLHSTENYLEAVEILDRLIHDYPSKAFFMEELINDEIHLLRGYSYHLFNSAPLKTPIIHKRLS